MTKVVRIDNDVHQLAVELIESLPQASRPSKQQLLNETLRNALRQRARKLSPSKRRRPKCQ